MQAAIDALDKQEIDMRKLTFDTIVNTLKEIWPEDGLKPRRQTQEEQCSTKRKTHAALQQTREDHEEQHQYDDWPDEWPMVYHGQQNDLCDEALYDGDALKKK